MTKTAVNKTIFKPGRAFINRCCKCLEISLYWCYAERNGKTLKICHECAIRYHKKQKIARPDWLISRPKRVERIPATINLEKCKTDFHLKSADRSRIANTFSKIESATDRSEFENLLFWRSIVQLCDGISPRWYTLNQLRKEMGAPAAANGSSANRAYLYWLCNEGFTITWRIGNDPRYYRATKKLYQAIQKNYIEPAPVILGLPSANQHKSEIEKAKCAACWIDAYCTAYGQIEKDLVIRICKQYAIPAIQMAIYQGWINENQVLS